MYADVDQSDSTEPDDVGARDLRFGVIGLGLMALVPIIFRIFV
jgi:hypothetical protein